MGGFTSKTQQDLKFYLQRQYDITNYPSITHHLTKKQAIVHQITTDSTQQAHRIRSDVNLYKHLHCQSISNILQYIPLQSSKICSDQQYHYIIEQDIQSYNLKQQFFARKYYKQTFTSRQIMSVIKTFVCGLNIYHSQFHRKFHGLIKLEWMTVDQRNDCHLRLTDPLLMAEFSFGDNVSLTVKEQERVKSHVADDILHQEHNSIKQAPQRVELRKTRFNETKIQLNELLADLYVVGVIGLQLHRMQLFQKSDKHEVLSGELEKIEDKQLKRVLKILTSQHAEQRGEIFQLLKISAQQMYCLERCFKKGKLNKEHIEGNKPIELNGLVTGENVSLNKQNVIGIKKQNSFSFGTSPPPQTLPIYNNNSIHRQNNNNHNFTKNNTFTHQYATNNFTNQHTNNNIITTTSKPLQYVSTLPQIQTNHLTLLGFKSFQTAKTETLSNMSTDRTIYHSKLQTIPYSSYNSTTSKPTIIFNNSISSIIPPSTTYSSHNNLQHASHYVSSTHLTNKQQQKPRANSFLINQEKTPLIKENDMKKHNILIKEDLSPYKKQDQISPLSHKQHSLEEGNYKQIFGKYPHINYESHTPSPNKLMQTKKMQQEMDRLLNQSSNRKVQTIKRQQTMEATKQHYSQSNNKFSPINGKELQIDSPINSLQPNQLSSFAMRQKLIKEQSETSIVQQLPIYRPNKQVQQILKRLGIGSLLYGNAQTKEQQNTHTQQQQNNKLKLTQNQNETIQSQDTDTFIHRGNYNIQNQVQFSTNKSSNKNNQQPSDYQDTPDRQTTPIRPTNKANKYNSTIVQVGDQDSQYSSSGVRNTQHNIDLTDHQYVVEEYQTGSRYQGYKLNGERDGQGKFFYQDGGYYQGQWKNNKMDGWGKLYYEGGKLAYEGNWSQDQFHGFGKVYNDNPVHLECGFDFTNFDLLEDYWEYYEGMLVKDTKEGRGKIMLTNAELFEGDFHNDRIQGFGKFFMKQGTMIQGIWRDSKLIKIISS